MTASTRARPPKWPFLLGDFLLVGVAAVIVLRAEGELDALQMLLCTGAVALGAWLGIRPFSDESHLEARLAEAASLEKALSQFRTLDAVAAQITAATWRWQAVQDQATQAVEKTQQLGDRLTREAASFAESIARASDQEKAALRLEVEKLHRAEADWLHVLGRILDHVFALHQAAMRSEQAHLIDQLTHFQNACRDAARRVGLSTFTPQPGEPFDERAHQLHDAQASPPAGACVAATLATGLTYQGRLLRRAVVMLESAPSPASAVPGAAPETSAGS